MVRIGCGLFCVATATLMLELTLVRVFDVIWYANMAYMVITLAMFCFGLSGIYLTFNPYTRVQDIRPHLSRLCCCFALSSLVLLPALNAIPCDFEQIYTHPTKAIPYFLLIYVFLITPFFFAGCIFTAIFSSYANAIQRLYCWDLAGAAGGCLLLIPFLPPIGPGGILFVIAALALLASCCFSPQRTWQIASFALAGIVAVIPFCKDGYFDFRYHTDKRSVAAFQHTDKVEDVYWDPISKIEVITGDNPMDVIRRERAASIARKQQLAGTNKAEAPPPQPVVRTLKHVAYDGGSQSSYIFPFDGNFEQLRREISEGKTGDHFYGEKVWISHAFKQDTNQEVLIIGAAGGSEIKAALTFGAAHVDAVEMVGHVVDLGTTRYASYNGNIFNHPHVNAVTGEGRSFLRSTTKQYDIIQMFSNHTSSSIAAGSGAMATTYLQTVEAYQEYFGHLKDDGLLHINHHAYPRMIVTAARAWENMGRSDFARHVLVYEYTGRGVMDVLPTMLIKMTPWTRAECERVRAFFPPAVQAVVNPLDPSQTMLSPEFFSGSLSSATESQVGYRVGAATDDRPYFNFLRKSWARIAESKEKYTEYATASLLNSQLKNGWIPTDILHLIVTAGASFFFMVCFILVPLLFSRIGRTPWVGKASSLMYFSALGAGFIIFELVFIQIFMKLIGYPLYTYATVVFALLMAAGVGSLVSEQLNITPGHRWGLPFWGILGSGALLLLIYQPYFTFFLQKSALVRILAAVLLLFPVGFFLGMPFPLGILALEKQPPGAIAWAWGMNGLFTVIGGLASVLLSLYFGFQCTLLVALLMYAAAFVAFIGLRRSTVLLTG